MIRVEKMKPEHLDWVIELGLSTSEFQTGTDAPQFYSKETLSRWIKGPNGVLLTALVNNNFAGFSITGYNPDSRDGYIHCIVVNGSYRKKGIGGNLLENTLSELKTKGCNHIFALVKEDNDDTKRFFERHNFEIGGAFNYTERVKW